MPKRQAGESRAGQGNGGKPDPDLTRLSEAADDQIAAASDQSFSDTDQTASDSDQTASDEDQELSARDQEASNRDQLASDRDQAMSDRELEDHPGTAAKTAHDLGLAERQEGSRDRKESTETRSGAAERRARLANERDEIASGRDLTARTRDGDADRRDRESAKIERKMGSRGSPLRSALVHAAEIRAQAARDRARAADDRAQAATDRQRAAEEREEALAELRRAHLDELTGAFRRGSGDAALQGEIDRARRGDGRLVLAFVDVDGLREVNNRDGHPAGDNLLRGVVAAIRSKIRSYEPIVRFGGDEFVCTMSSLDLDQAEKRFKSIQEMVGARGGAVSVGLAKLQPEQTLDDLIDRADAALLESRRARSSGPD